MPDEFPFWFEAIARILKMPVWAASLLLTGIIGAVFVVSDQVAGVSTQHRFTVVSAVLISFALAPVMSILVRNRSVAAYRQLLPVIDSNEFDRFRAMLKETYDQRRAIGFGLAIAAGGLVHHVLLSYFEWGRIWWYSLIDIVLVGFFWWFVVGTFLWTCISVTMYSFLASKRLKFSPLAVSGARMGGLEAFGTLSIIPSVAWALVATVGTISTFDPHVSMQFPRLLVMYLVLDFVIIAGSMTVIFSLPVLAFREIILPFKRDLLGKLTSAVQQLDEKEILPIGNSETALRRIYLWQAASEIEQIKEWPLSFGSGVGFILSYFIPGTVFLGRLILLFIFHVQLPF